MKQGGHIKGTPLQAGPLIAKAANLSGYADYKENAFALFKLMLAVVTVNPNFFLPHSHSCPCRPLANHPSSPRKIFKRLLITIAMNMGFVPTQRGDDEANFSCDWNDENVKRLIQMLKLRIRRPAPAYAFEKAH